MIASKLATILGALTVAALSMGQSRDRGVDEKEAQRHPQDALFRSMEESRKMNVEAIVMRKTYNGESSTRFKFEQSARGTSKYTVLAPICDQGAVMYDNGKVMKSFMPDEKKLFVHDSPRHNAQIALRQALAEKNYRFVAETGAKVAGRPTIVIIALPRATGMPSRRYSIDVASTYLLRVETEMKGDRKTLTDTEAINYPRSISVSDPEKEFFSEIRRIEIPAPVSVSSNGSILELVGFKPALPAELPFGFATIDRQVDERRNSVAIRISDGLAHATILQSRVDRDKQRTPSSMRREAKGFEFKLIGDLPDQIISRLLDIFIREALKGLNPLAETESGAEMLDVLQKNIGDSVLIALIIDVA